ncbi:PAS domain S-box protein [Candidatus Thorarchaeota archaeon]|nr:MAG: PAS domain S-box protein [Candidatus Thorarchaeota archaeon]
MSDATQDTQWIQKVMEVVHDGRIVIQDEDIVMANEVFSDMLGYPIDDVLDIALEDVVEPQTRRRDSDLFEKLYSGEIMSQFPTRLVSKNGQIVHVEIKPTSVTFDGASAILACVRNVSTQVTLETTVTELENRFATLYDMSPVAYFMLSKNGSIEQVNAAAEELLGIEAEELIGKPISQFLPEPKPGYDPAAEIVREVLRGKSVKGLEMEMFCGNNKTIWISASSRALDSGPERPVSIGFTAIDITRRRAMEQKLMAESERANLYMEVMTSDLNMTNQNVIFALEDLSISLELPERLQVLLSEASWSLRNAARMIANMGVLMSLHHEPPVKTQTKLLPHFNKAIREATRDFEWKTLDVKSNIADISYEVNGHAFMWYIFFNIIHFSGRSDVSDKVRLEINAEMTETDDMLRIEFLDFGPGIPDDQKSQIFRREGSADDKLEGKGLGLTVADRYISDLGGRIWVEDRVSNDSSKGSKFVILLPLWKEALQLPPIMYYKSDHCIFCGPVLVTLKSVLNELGIGASAIHVINVDEPESIIAEEELPALPTIQMGMDQLSGFLSEDDLREAVSKMIFMSGG